MNGKKKSFRWDQLKHVAMVVSHELDRQRYFGDHRESFRINSKLCSIFYFLPNSYKNSEKTVPMRYFSFLRTITYYSEVRASESTYVRTVYTVRTALDYSYNTYPTAQYPLQQL